MAKKMSGLQQALESQQAKPVAPPPPAKPPAPSGYVVPESRVGKVPISAYFPPDFRKSLGLVSVQTGRSQQSLLAEAMNDLFVKYDVPTIQHE